MKMTFRKYIFTVIACIFGLWIFTLPVKAQSTDANNNFSTSLGKWVESIREHLDNPIEDTLIGGKVTSLMLKVIDVLFPIIVIVGVLVAMFGLYSILTSSDSWKLKDGVSMMVYGAIAIIIMYSAKYLSWVIFSDLFKTGSGEAMTTIDWITVLYDKIWFPFIKIAVYLSLGFLVILMMTRVFAYITAQDDGTKKKAIGVITWTTVGMLFIIAAKQIVEAVYGKQDAVLKRWTSNLSQIWTQILNPKEIPIFFTIMNWALGLVAFVLLLLILVQTYKILTKPDDTETFKSLKKTIIYALWGILLIGSAYLIANLLIFN